MIKIYFTERHEKYRLHPLLYKKYGVDIKQLGIEKKAAQFNYDFEEVSNPEAADIFIVPHSFGTINPKIENILKKDFDKVSHLKKPFIITLFGDMSHDSHLPFGTILKVSAYKDTLKENERVIPAFSEDWSDTVGFKPLPKKERPIISFCGLAQTAGIIAYKKYLIKIILSFPTFYRAPGLYFRKKLMSIFRASGLFETDFIVRDHFSSSQTALKGKSYEDMRSDFYRTITESHFVIAPKGDGNYSNRFYETLSLGRIPVCPDTNIVLPFENKLDYSKYCIISPIQDIEKMPLVAKDFYDKVVDMEAFQNEIKQFYKDNLRFDICFMNILKSL